MQKQRGIVLVIAIIFLTVVTLIGVSTANIVMNNTRVIENVHYKDQVRTIAKNAIEEAITTSGFLEGEKAFTISCREDSYTRCYDLSGDGVERDAYVTLSRPQCISVQPVLNNSLNVWTNEVDASCYQTATAENGYSKYSLCAESLWEVNSVAFDPVSNARVYYKHGITVRAPINLVAAVCKGELNVLTNG